jgi:hypothetical protein
VEQFSNIIEFSAAAHAASEFEYSFSGYTKISVASPLDGEDFSCIMLPVKVRTDLPEKNVEVFSNWVTRNIMPPP